MAPSSFYSESELAELGLRACGEDVRISRKASLYSPERLSIGDHSRIDDFCILSGDITLGAHVHVAPMCLLFGAQGIVLESFSGLSSRVAVYTESEDYVRGTCLTNPTVPAPYRKVADAGGVRLGRHAIVGCGAVILPGATLGVGTAVGALALVRGALQDWSVYVGNPAKRVATRHAGQMLELERQLLEAEANRRGP